MAMVMASIFITYWETIQVLYHQWISNDDFSHGLLIVPIAVYLAWKKKDLLISVEPKTDWRALGLLIASMLVYIIGELGAELFTTRVSMIVFFIASVWFLFGIEMLRTLRFPLAFLFLMLPLPGFLYRNLTFPLQLLSSKLSVDIMHTLGIMAYREGNIIDMGFTQFEVAEACNGLRFILPLLTVGVLFAFYGAKPWWKRLVLVGITIPFAILANVMRIAGTGIISLHYGPKVAEGFFHSFSGWAVFMTCFGFFLIVNQTLKLFPDQPRKTQTARHKTGEERKPAFRFQLAPLVIACGIILSAVPVVGHLGQVAPRPLERPLTEFPRQMAGWVGKDREMDAAIWERVGGQSYVMIDYTKPGEYPVGFYTAYYEYQRKAGDFIHSPKLCLPGAGWFIEKSSVRALDYSEDAPQFGTTIKFNEVVMSKNQHRQLVYYWYQGRDRNFTNEYAAKFLMVWDGIWRRRTDGALVRLITTIPTGKSVEEVRTLLDGFVLSVSRELEDYLP